MSASAARDVRCCPACGAVYRAEFPRCVNDGAELVLLDHDPLLGTNVGPYVVDALIGEGGMGRVYRVHHARLTQKRYALKVLLGDLAATPAMRMRFAKEAQSASRLSHPNVVAVCDFGVTDAGLAYLAMDLVEGEALYRLMAAGAMPADRVIRLARQLCAGLAHAHDLGLIHRDFKPDNIIVVDEPAGEVPRIADFGLAITSDATDIRLTTTGTVMGTPAYIAPEQCIAGDVDRRADLYALGVTMFEMLTGGFLPFDGDAAEIVGLKATTSPPTMAECAPHVAVPPALSAIVDRLIARAPADRYPDARAVSAALDEAVRYPDDAALARGAPHPPRADDTPVGPARRRAPRADDEAIVRSRTTPARAAIERGPTTPASPFDYLHTEPMQRPRRPIAGFAIAGGAILLAGLVVAAIVWSTRSPAANDPPPADPALTVARATPDPASPVVPDPSPRATPDPSPRTTQEPPDTTEPPTRPDRARAQKRLAKPKPKRSAKPVTAIQPIAPPPVEPTPLPRPAVTAAPLPPSPPPPPPPAPAPLALEPHFAGLDVQGALPNATVRRALDRVLPATRACRSDRTGAVEVRFAIGESRRAAGIRASGLATSSCLAGALAALRTDAAPDVGDVDVRVRFAYENRE